MHESVGQERLLPVVSLSISEHASVKDGAADAVAGWEPPVLSAQALRASHDEAQALRATGKAEEMTAAFMGGLIGWTQSTIK